MPKSERIERGISSKTRRPTIKLESFEDTDEKGSGGNPQLPQLPKI